MGKLVSIETFERFETLWNANRIDLRSLTFILDTGQLYTHGIFLNSVVYGEEASGAVPVTIAGVTKTLALSSHNHDATYYKKTENINLGTYKLVSGEKELIYLNNAKIYVGDTTLPIQIQSNGAIKSYRDLHEYTMLDTGNFSIENKTTTNYTLSNVATIKYGSNSFQLDYIKRLNTSSTFDTLSAYTSAGTTLVNGTLYGFMTFYTDGTTLNPSWAQLRIDISNKTLEIRTSASTNWVGFPTGSYKNIKVNNTDYALLTSENSLPTIYAPASAGTGFLKGSTDGNGNITWTWDNSTYNNYSLSTATDSLLGGVKVGTTLESTTGYTAVHIKDGVIYYKNYTATPILGRSTAISNATSDTSDPYLNIIENGAKSGSIQITGSGGTSVKAKNGILTISSPSLGTGASDAAKGNHDHTLSIATDNGTNEVSLSAGTKYKLTAGGKTLIFTTPSDTKYTLTLNGTAKGTTGGIDLGTFYAIATSDSSIANQVWMRNSDNTAYAWRTLGSRAFDSTAYLPLAGGTMTGNISFSGDNNITWSRNTDYAKIHFKNTGDGDSDSYLGFETADNGNEYFRFGHTSGTYTEWMSIKSDGVRVNGTKVSLEGHNHDSSYVTSLTTNGNYLRWVKNGANNDITIPYATNADTVDDLHASSFYQSGKGFLEGSQAYNANWNALFTYESAGGAARSFLLNIEAHHNSTVINKTFHITTTLVGGAHIRELYSTNYGINFKIRVGSASSYWTHTRVDIQKIGGYDGTIRFKVISLDQGTITAVNDTNVSALSYSYEYETCNIEQTVVSSSAKLLTSRALWGLSFNGTDNVYGDIILGYGLNHTIGEAYSSTDTNRYNYIRFYSGYSDGDIEYAAGRWTSGDHIGHLFTGYSGQTILAMRTVTGNVGIGTTNPSYKLNVVGDIYSTEYIRAANGFVKTNSSDSHVLLGGGGHYSLANILHGDSYGTMEGTISDCDSVDRTGVYSSSGFSNRPSDVENWGTLFNLRLYSSNNLYHRQLFFDCYNSDRIWTRSDNNGTWTSWKELITSNNIGSQSVNHAASADTATTATRFEYITNWNSPKVLANIINLMSDTSASATTNGAPVRYASGISIVTNYTGFQLASYGGGGESLYFRKLQDNSIWHNWYEVITTANIGSQSVNYATSAGPANAGGTTTPVYWNNYQATACTSIPWSFISDKPSLAAVPNQRWAATIQGQNWSRLYTGNISTLHHSSIFSIEGSIGCVVFSGTYLVLGNHSTCAHITQLTDGNYTLALMRVLVNSAGEILVDMYWAGNDCSTGSSTLTMTIYVTALAFIGSITPCTSLTNDTSIPSGFTNAMSINSENGTLISYRLRAIENCYAVNFYTTSDRLKKQNISSFSEHIRKFQLKDTEKWHYGVIAQEVPEMFRDGEEGNMTVNYNSVLSYYIGILENRVQELENKIKQLENK